MAVTETPPETVETASAAAPSAPHPQPGGLAAVLGSGDHKVIGRLYIVAALLLGLPVLGLGLAFGVEGFEPETLDVFSSDVAYQLFTLLRVGTLFLLAFPLIIGVAMVVVPLQVGSRSIAFPRAAAASFWGWFLGSILLIASYAINGGPGGGSANGVNLWIAAMGLIVASVLLAAVCLATTVLALRTDGLSLERTPLFAWSVAIASIMWVFTLPVLGGMLVLMYVDHRHGGALALGGSAGIYPALAWIFRNPQIYVLAVPVLGFAADVFATASGSRQRMRGLVQGAIGVFGAVSFGAFLAIPSTDALDSLLVVVLGIAAVVPVLVVAGGALDAVRGSGSLKAGPGVAYAAAGILMLVVGTLAGAIGSIPGVLEVPEGSSASSNIFFLGITHAVVVAAVIAALGGITWWASKVGRGPAASSVGLVAPLLLLVGGIVMTVPDFVSGIVGDGVETQGDYAGGIAAANVVVAIGVAIVALGLLAAAVSLLPLLRRPDDEVPADPWGGQTLEWLAPSPPPVGNFEGELAVVASAEPLYDLREEK
ncbi:MAG: cbb3-type cytochrome c oxidase subunit I [Acidimicrobiales bacterium]|nr:cbb3-type cytochrome c oxidase subunit I [Acidimicrobiales bacterium]HRW37563.1 cbb3-type cytochrome c oxidase subunit I [Aquihabitans sp.]